MSINSPRSIEVPELNTILMDKVAEHGLRGEVGGIGFSILNKIGVAFPSPDNFLLSDCLREDEIKTTWSKLEKGEKVWWEGGDGYGKTTFLGELGLFIRNQDYQKGVTTQVFQIFPASFRTADNIRDQLSRLEYYSSASGAKAAKNVIYFVDSADYLWEDSGDRLLQAKKLELFHALIASPCKVVMTAHDVEPKNKKVDSSNKIRFEALMKIYKIDRNKLSPLYPADKVTILLERVGFPPKIAGDLVDNDFFYQARHHGVLSNYIIGGEDKYSIKFLLSWLSSLVKIGTNNQEIVKMMKDVFVGRNSQRIRDWMTIGF